VETKSGIPVDRIPLINIPRKEKTIENPDTKKTEFSITFDLFMVKTDLRFPLNSLIVLPEIYAIKAGTIGKMQGATNEAKPARIAMAMVISDMSKVGRTGLIKIRPYLTPISKTQKEF
jgi:hypothetical protein